MRVYFCLAMLLFSSCKQRNNEYRSGLKGEESRAIPEYIEKIVMKSNLVNPSDFPEIVENQHWNSTYLAQALIVQLFRCPTSNNLKTALDEIGESSKGCSNDVNIPASNTLSYGEYRDHLLDAYKADKVLQNQFPKFEDFENMVILSRVKQNLLYQYFADFSSHNFVNEIESDAMFSTVLRPAIVAEASRSYAVTRCYARGHITAERWNIVYKEDDEFDVVFHKDKLKEYSVGYSRNYSDPALLTLASSWNDNGNEGRNSIDLNWSLSDEETNAQTCTIAKSSLATSCYKYYDQMSQPAPDGGTYFFQRGKCRIEPKCNCKKFVWDHSIADWQ